MSKQPFLSVVIPLYNKENYIESTIKSVLNQSFQNFEIVVVNDGSTDNSVNVVKKLNDPRVRLYSNKNHGLSYTRNFGIKKSIGKYIALLDADDLWRSDYLDCISYFIKSYKNEFVFATNNYTWFHKKTPNLKVPPKSAYNSKLIKDYFSYRKNLFSYSSIVFHKSVFDKIGYFNENVNHGEEEEFSIKCLLHYNLVYTSDKKVFYLRNVKNQLTAPNQKRIRVLPNYGYYLENNSNKYLKKYIDFIHYKLVLLYKMEQNQKLVKFYKKKISVSNLSGIQKIKYHLPTQAFYYIKSVQIWFSNIFIHS
jgi:glycosyltransferase involved in cell wall biosynthesis